MKTWKTEKIFFEQIKFHAKKFLIFCDAGRLTMGSKFIFATFHETEELCSHCNRGNCKSVQLKVLNVRNAMEETKFLLRNISIWISPSAVDNHIISSRLCAQIIYVDCYCSIRLHQRYSLCIC